MTNTDVSGHETATSKRRTVSKREFIDDGGTVVKSMEEAAGARYILLGDKGEHVRVFDQLFGEAGKAETMYAIMGFHTKLGNVANTVLNDKDDPGTPEQAADEVDGFIALVNEGKWAERGTGGGGFQKVDRDALTAAICAYGESKGKTQDPLNVRQKLDDNTALIGQWRKVPEVLADYTRRVGSRGVDADKLLEGLI